MTDNQTTRREHELKVSLAYWHPLANGEKPFEVRRDDRGFQRGDTLLLRCWNPTFNCHESAYEPVRKRISYILTGGQFGIEPGYVVMGLQDA